jgi:hypothetical protein
MKNRYKEFTASMKALFWGAVVLTLISIICLVLTLIPNNALGGIFFILSPISLFLTCILLLILAAKIWEMEKREK